MADFHVPVKVTKISNDCPNDINNCFRWSFDGDHDLNLPSIIVTVPEGTIKTIEITLQAGTPGDSVIFRNTPLEFDGGTPSWLNVPQGGSSSITLTDNNTSAQSEGQTAEFFIHATYTPSGSSEGHHIHSPDPTIVNAGTGGRRWLFSVR